MASEVSIFHSSVLDMTKELLQKGDKTMKALFLRNFSSIHVHYVPLQGYGDLGTVDIIFQQNARLSEQIQADTERVQNAREKAWMKFDSV